MYGELLDTNRSEAGTARGDVCLCGTRHGQPCEHCRAFRLRDEGSVYPKPKAKKRRAELVRLHVCLGEDGYVAFAASVFLTLSTTQSS